MKQLLEFIPLVLFFVFFKTHDIYTAVKVLMIASSIAIILAKPLLGKIEKIMLFSYLMVMFFGALTLYFHNDLFIKWKVTIIYGVLALILFFSQFILKKNVLKTMLGKELELPSTVWRNLSLAWTLFFIFCSLLNIYVMFALSQQAWVNFKAFGLMGLTIIFTLLNGIYIYKYLAKPTQENHNSNP